MDPSNDWHVPGRPYEDAPETETLKTIDANFPERTLFAPPQLRLSLAIVLVAICAGFSGCTSADSKQQQRAQAAGPRVASVAVAKVQQQEVPSYLTGVGWGT